MVWSSGALRVMLKNGGKWVEIRDLEMGRSVRLGH